jgi:tripartite-type tricarboxylate transporter receptor subunit TctC
MKGGETKGAGTPAGATADTAAVGLARSGAGPRRRVLRALGAAALASLGAAAHAQQPAWPVRPLRMIVPFPPGGSTDIVGRTVAERLAAALGQPMAVENRAGATGAIGLEALARSAPDGYTIGLGTIGSVAINPLVAAKLTWDPQRDFAPIGMVGSTPFALLVNNALPARTLAELIAMARAKPGALAYASGGIGGSQHLATALLEDMTGTSMNHVPYKGSGPALTDLIGGQVQAMMEPAVSAAPHVRAGRVRALALTGARRSSAFPDVPVIAETVPGYEAAAWFAILAPAGTPPEIVTRLSTELRAALRAPELIERFEQAGVEVSASTPEQLRDTLRGELDKWGRLVKKLNITPQ